MSKTTILNLTLKKKWFDMIASGEKKEEYRERKEYWINRLCEEYAPGIVFKEKHFDYVRFRNGYNKNAPEITVECKGIDIREGEEKWGAIPGEYYFVIKLGKPSPNKQ